MCAVADGGLNRPGRLRQLAVSNEKGPAVAGGAGPVGAGGGAVAGRAPSRPKPSGWTSSAHPRPAAFDWRNAGTPAGTTCWPASPWARPRCSGHHPRPRPWPGKSLMLSEVAPGRRALGRSERLSQEALPWCLPACRQQCASDGADVHGAHPAAPLRGTVPLHSSCFGRAAFEVEPLSRGTFDEDNRTSETSGCRWTHCPAFRPKPAVHLSSIGRSNPIKQQAPAQICACQDAARLCSRQRATPKPSAAGLTEPWSRVSAHFAADRKASIAAAARSRKPASNLSAEKVARSCWSKP